MLWMYLQPGRSEVVQSVGLAPPKFTQQCSAPPSSNLHKETPPPPPHAVQHHNHPPRLPLLHPQPSELPSVSIGSSTGGEIFTDLTNLISWSQPRSAAWRSCPLSACRWCWRGAASTWMGKGESSVCHASWCTLGLGRGACTLSPRESRGAVSLHVGAQHMQTLHQTLDSAHANRPNVGPPNPCRTPPLLPPTTTEAPCSQPRSAS